MELTIIEEYTDDGAIWGISTAGANPPADEFVRVSCREEAERIVAAAERGDISPFLRAAGVMR